MVVKTPAEVFLSDLKHYSREPIKTENFRHYKSDSNEFWYKDNPLMGGGYAGQGPVENKSMLEEMLILNRLGEKSGMKLELPLPQEVLEIGLSEDGANFVENFLTRQNKAGPYRINNGIILQKTNKGMIARKVESVKVSDRMEPSEVVVIDENHNIVSNSYRQPDSVRLFPITGKSQEITTYNGNFKKKFSGMIPSGNDMKTQEYLSTLFGDEEKRTKEEYPFEWKVPNGVFDKDNLAVISTWNRPPANVGAFPMKIENPNFYSLTSVIPIFTRENPKK